MNSGGIFSSYRPSNDYGIFFNVSQRKFYYHIRMKSKNAWDLQQVQSQHYWPKSVLSSAGDVGRKKRG